MLPITLSLNRLKPLLDKIIHLSLQDKRAFLDKDLIVKNSLKKSDIFSAFLKNRTLEEEIVLKSLLILEEGEFFENYIKEEKIKEINHLLQTLVEVENFYEKMGGLIGYHVKVLELMQEKLEPHKVLPRKANYYKPYGLDISKDKKQAEKAVMDGLKALEYMAEIYPIGGAGDRLGLISEKTQEPLPVACLIFRGKTLLEGLIRDLQAREYLVYKVLKKQVKVPIALMTSVEKNNHQHIQEIFQDNNWFGRGRDNYRFFIQPLVPVITSEGKWLMNEKQELVCKPGGHGVLWKLAKKEGVFSWLEGLKHKKILIRQINNPIVGLDDTLLAFAGVGTKKNKAFGFLSCLRRVNSAEGTLVLSEEVKDKSYHYKISNIEYTDFEKYALHDMPEEGGGEYSCFPSNTNVLFADIKKIQKAMEEAILPGMLVNMKKIEGQEIYSGRLETTMQNIADYIENSTLHPLPKEGQEDFLDTFVLYNQRKKTISVTKKAYKKDESFFETPESAFYDLLQNNRDLLELCKMKVPKEQSIQDYLKNGPSFLFLYHPALGPLYSVIVQKIRGGKIHENAELQLEIAEIDIENLELDGSLLITADSPLGIMNKDLLLYDDKNCPRCTLYDVKVKNRGEQALEIKLFGNGEFVAKSVTLEGHKTIEIKEGERVTALQEKGEIIFKREKITSPSWFWDYQLEEDFIKLVRQDFF